jgi:cell wall-associated NlpC family hydrolase
MTTTLPAIQKMLDWQAAHKGKVRYSESASTRLANATGADLLTATDCSGMFHRMMMHFGQIDVGTYTGNECTHGTLVTLSKSAAHAGYGMLPGDGILFDWDGGRWDHIAMYAGGGRIWNHGGPGNGPLNWSLASNVDNAVKIMVRRYIAPAKTVVTHLAVAATGSGNPMHGHAIPALIARGTGDYYGLITGPNASHGGAYTGEQPAVRLIQEFLNWNLKAGLEVDGIFDPTTQAAVTRFQKAYLPTTEFFGQVWYDDWAKMASL